MELEEKIKEEFLRIINEKNISRTQTVFEVEDRQGIFRKIDKIIFNPSTSLTVIAYDGDIVHILYENKAYGSKQYPHMNR